MKTTLLNKLRSLKPTHLYIIYLLLIGGTFLYVRDVLTNRQLELEEPKREEKEEEFSPAVVFVQLEQGGKSENFRYRLSTKETVSELLESARDDKHFLFEKTLYRKGEIIDSVNGQENTETHAWRIYMQRDAELQDITENVQEIQLEEGYTYILRFVKRTPTNTLPDKE